MSSRRPGVARVLRSLLAAVVLLPLAAAALEALDDGLVASPVPHMTPDPTEVP